MKAIILCRVSTKEQEDGHSLSAQKERLKEYCQRRDLEVIKHFEIIESSTRGERKEFVELLEFAKKQKEIVAIVADAVDRVQRGFKESITLDELIRKEAIELHFYREGMIIGKNASASDVMRWDFSVMGAKSYVLNLSENVKRSLQYKVKNGEWIGSAPIGYLNARDNAGKATLEIDPVRAPLIKRLFDEYATGAFSINEMSRRTKEWGLRNKTKKAGNLSPSQVQDILKKKFYMGQMEVNGYQYPHKYDPIIDTHIFDRCQHVMQGNSRTDVVKQTKNDFIFRGILTCAISGRKVTSDLKKKKFVYLICRNPNSPDKKLYIPEHKILSQIEGVFKSLHIPESLVEKLKEHLKGSHQAEMDFHVHAIKQLEKENDSIQTKQDKLLDIYIDGSITQDIYEVKQQKLKQRQYEIHQELTAHHKADDSFRITVSSLVSLASKAYELFKSSKNEQKRQLINFMFSNLQLNGEKLEYALRSPFHLMVNVDGYEEWLTRLDTIRTKYLNDIILIQTILPGCSKAIYG